MDGPPSSHPQASTSVAYSHIVDRYAVFDVRPRVSRIESSSAEAQSGDPRVGSSVSKLAIGERGLAQHETGIGQTWAGSACCTCSAGVANLPESLAVLPVTGTAAEHLMVARRDDSWPVDPSTCMPAGDWRTNDPSSPLTPIAMAASVPNLRHARTMAITQRVHLWEARRKLPGVATARCVTRRPCPGSRGEVEEPRLRQGAQASFRTRCALPYITASSTSSRNPSRR